MKILAYTAQRYLQATLATVGRDADILISPPLVAADIQPFWLEGYDVFYVDLHGQAGSVRLWSGLQQRYAALDAKTIQATNLTGTIVFLTSCFLPETPFIKMFLEARATCVIGGAGKNYGTRTRISGAQKLAKLFLDGLRWGQEPGLALISAKKRLSRSLSRLLSPRATKDSLQFNLWEKNSDN